MSKLTTKEYGQKLPCRVFFDFRREFFLFLFLFCPYMCDTFFLEKLYVIGFISYFSFFFTFIMFCCTRSNVPMWKWGLEIWIRQISLFLRRRSVFTDKNHLTTKTKLWSLSISTNHKNIQDLFLVDLVNLGAVLVNSS